MGDISAALTDMWRSVFQTAPKVLAFIAIVAVGWIIARVVRRVVNTLLEKVGFDRLVQRGAVGQAMARGRYDASDILARLAYYALMLMTLQLAFSVFGPNAISTLITAVVAWLPKAFVAVVIVMVAGAIGSAAKDLITNSLAGLSYGRLLGNAVSAFVLAMGVIAALNQVGIATSVTTPVLITALATVGGIAIVGVGGGLVRPMTQRWDRWLERAEAETAVIKEQTQGYTAGRGDLDRQMADRTGAAASTASSSAAAGMSAGRESAASSAGTSRRGSSASAEQL